MIKKHAIVKFKNEYGRTLQGLVSDVGTRVVTIKIPDKTYGKITWVVPKTELIEVWQ